MKLTIEVKFMFDRRTYMSDPNVIKAINRYNFGLYSVHVINIAICIGLLVYGIAVKSIKAILI